MRCVALLIGSVVSLPATHFGVAMMKGSTESPWRAASSTTGSKAPQLYGPFLVGWTAGQISGVRTASIPPAFMYSASFSVTGVCGTIPKKPFGAFGIRVVAAAAGVVDSPARR